ncbi:Spherulin-1A [Pseudocercospora fuligena]|uniref:Spherulin-1A n=1 Tax=Pseudocercospora fuligena TaxID=685502 RepID=A0A8H6VQD9_9PEZI|nr:Spherulin-1A [Pseudocercospora fuligena]
MTSNIARYIVAGLGATASVSAFPQGPNGQQQQHTTFSTAISAPSSTPFAIPTINQPPTPSPVNSEAAAAAASANTALAQEALGDVTNVARFNTLLTIDGAGKELLPADQLKDRVVFDFAAKAQPLGKGGRFVLANQNNFPVLVDQNIATAVGFLNPCGMNSPHTHPRATEWLTTVQGTLKTGFMLENGFLANAGEGRQTTQVSAELGPFQGTVFPQGSIHFQFNDNCSPATFIATLNSDDPGTSQIAQNFFFLDEKIVNITLGEPMTVDGSNIEEFRLTLPPNLVQAVDGCLKRCEGKY